MPKTTQLISPEDLWKSPSLKPTIGGTFNNARGLVDGLERRTSSPNAQDEKLYENQKDAPVGKTGG